MTEPTDAEMMENIARIKSFCREFNHGKITRAECKRRLMEDCRLHEHKLDELLDVYDPSLLQ